VNFWAGERVPNRALADGAADTIYVGDLSKSVMMYEHAGLTGESSRDAEFALDNTLFRFGWPLARGWVRFRRLPGRSAPPRC
jgi:hypothetical protein